MPSEWENDITRKKVVHTFEVGDSVTDREPRIDHTVTDMHRLPCHVIDKGGIKYLLYRLQCGHSVLKSLYPVSELELHPIS